MASKAIQDILGYVPLTGMIRTTKTGIPDPLPEGFRSLTKNVVGDASRYMQRTGQRRTARQAMYGADARNTQLKEIEKRDAKLLHFYESIRLDMLTYQALRNYENYEMQDLAEQEINEQTAQFSARFDNTEIAVIQMVLNGGILYFDDDGNLLPSSSGATMTIDQGIPANNLNQLNSIIAASWATTTTDITQHLRNLHKTAIATTGYPLKYAFYGAKIPSYLHTNEKVQPYLARHAAMNNQLLTTNEIPNGLFDFTWIPVYKSFWEDYGGTNRFIFGDDTIVFTPEPSREWYELQLGSYLVPTTFDPAGEGSAVRNNFKQVYGKFGYGQAVRNPVTADVFYGHTFLPILKNPNVLYVADVTP